MPIHPREIRRGQRGHRDDRWTLSLPPRCPCCEYILSGLSEDRCPECGEPFSWHEIHWRTRDLAQQIESAPDFGFEGRFALGLAIWAWACWLLFRLTPLGGISWIAWTPLLFIVAAVLRSVVLIGRLWRTRHLPPWTPPLIGLTPSGLIIGLIAIAISLSLVPALLFIW